MRCPRWSCTCIWREPSLVRRCGSSCRSTAVTLPFPVLRTWTVSSPTLTSLNSFKRGSGKTGSCESTTTLPSLARPSPGSWCAGSSSTASRPRGCRRTANGSWRRSSRRALPGRARPAPSSRRLRSGHWPGTSPGACRMPEKPRQTPAIPLHRLARTE